MQKLKYVNLHDLQQCQPPLPDGCLSHRPFRTDSNDVCLSHRLKQIQNSNDRCLITGQETNSNDAKTNVETIPHQ